MKIVECVANVSVGKNLEKVEKLSNFLQGRVAQLLHCDAHPDADRTVFTIACPLSQAFDELLAFSAEVFNTVRVRDNTGVHPHVGSLDVVPFIPLMETSVAEANALARAFAKALWSRFSVPVCFYANLATRESQRRLHSYRKRGHSGLLSLLEEGLISFDEGDSLHPDHGLTLVTARPLMLAFNITLDTNETSVAKKIAAQIRAHSKSDYRLEGLEAIGWYMEQYGRSQVSMNVRAPDRVPLMVVFERVQAVAGLYGVSVIGSELIGLCPISALNGSNDLNKHDIQSIARTLGLSYHSPFVVEERILEYRLNATMIRGAS